MKPHFEKTILLYGLEPMQTLKLCALAQAQGIRCRPVPDSRVFSRIDELLTDRDTEGPAMHLTGRFALLAGFDGQQMQATALINSVAPGVIKAVRTEHNGQWRFADLCGEIAEEHRLMTRRK